MPTINLPPNLRQIFELINARLQKLETGKRFTAPNVATDPSAPVVGDVWLNTTSNQLKYVDKNGATQIANPASIYGRMSSAGGATQSPASSTEVTLTGYDTTAGSGVTMSTAAGTLTIVTTGRYMITANVSWASNATGVRRARLMRSGTAIALDLQSPGAALGFENKIVLTDYALTAVDVLSVLAYQTSGGALAAGGAAPANILSATYIGPV
jgi:hypothetical protein